MPHDSFPSPQGIALSQGTDFYLTDELLTPQEREVRDTVRHFCDIEVIRGEPALLRRQPRAHSRASSSCSGSRRIETTGGVCSVTGD